MPDLKEFSERAGMQDWLDATSSSLVRRAQARDGQAWDRLVRLYSPLVASWCHASGLGNDETADVLQEVFRAVWRAIDRFHHDRPGDSFRGWLRIITRNKVHDWRAKRARAPRAAGGTEQQCRWSQLADPLAQEPDETTHHAEVQIVLRSALESVRNEFAQRTWDAFWRVAVEGLAPDVVARDLGLTRAAVYKSKSRVLNRLRSFLGEFPP